MSKKFTETELQMLLSNERNKALHFDEAMELMGLIRGTRQEDSPFWITGYDQGQFTIQVNVYELRTDEVAKFYRDMQEFSRPIGAHDDPTTLTFKVPIHEMRDLLLEYAKTHKLCSPEAEIQAYERTASNLHHVVMPEHYTGRMVAERMRVVMQQIGKLENLDAAAGVNLVFRYHVPQATMMSRGANETFNCRLSSSFRKAIQPLFARDHAGTYIDMNLNGEALMDAIDAHMATKSPEDQAAVLSGTIAVLNARGAHIPKPLIPPGAPVKPAPEQPAPVPVAETPKPVPVAKAPGVKMAEEAAELSEPHTLHISTNSVNALLDAGDFSKKTLNKALGELGVADPTQENNAFEFSRIFDGKATLNVYPDHPDFHPGFFGTLQKYAEERHMSSPLNSKRQHLMFTPENLKKVFQTYTPEGVPEPVGISEAQPETLTETATSAGAAPPAAAEIPKNTISTTERASDREIILKPKVVNGDALDFKAMARNSRMLLQTLARQPGAQGHHSVKLVLRYNEADSYAQNSRPSPGDNQEVFFYTIPHSLYAALKPVMRIDIGQNHMIYLRDHGEEFADVLSKHLDTLPDATRNAAEAQVKRDLVSMNVKFPG